jgi:glycogen operon protein
MGRRAPFWRLRGDALEEVDDKGRRVVGETLLILVNAHHEPLTFTLPAHKRGVRWEHLLSTEEPETQKRVTTLKGGASYELEARSLGILRLRSQDRKAT